MRHARLGSFALVSVGAAAVCAADEDPYTLRRLRPASGFGEAGLVSEVRAGGGRLDRLRAIQLDGQGRLVVAGESLRLAEPTDLDPTPRPRVARFLPDGQLDRSFGAGGVAPLPLEGYVAGLVLDGQGRIVLAGRFTELASSQDLTTIAARLLPDGSLDRTFGGDGFTEFLGPHAPWLTRVALDPRDDAVLGVGSGGVWRWRSDGYLDLDYGVNGAAAVSPNALDVAVDSEGRAIVAAEEEVIRLTPAGERDRSFGAAGFLRGPTGDPMGTRSLAMDGAGRFVMRGHGSGVSRGLYRFLPDGAFDSSFGEGGVASVPFALPGDCEAPDPRIVASPGGEVRYALLGTVHRMGRDLSSFGGYGAFVQVVEPESLRELASWFRADPRVPRDHPPQSSIWDVAMSADGRFAYAAGSTELRAANGRWTSERPQLVRLDLRRGKPRGLPDLRLEWMGDPVIERFGPDAIQFVGTMRVTNAGQGVVVTAPIEISLSDDANPDAFDQRIESRTTGRIPPGRSKLIRYESVAYIGGAPRTFGRRLVAIANPRGWMPESRPGDAVAVSRPFEE